MAKTKTKNKKKIGKNGEIVISKFPDAVNALKHRYKADFPDVALFVNFNALGKNFIFQRFQSFPLGKISIQTKTNSIFFQAKWACNGALGYVLPKTFFDIEMKQSGDKIGWGEVSGFKPKTNFGMEIAKRGGEWGYVHELDDIKANVDLRIDNVKSLNMYDWGFEVIGEIMSILAVKKGTKCPRLPNKINMSRSNLCFSFGKDINDDNMIVRWSEPGYEPVKDKVSDFDKLMFNLPNEQEEQEKAIEDKVKNLGQRCMKNIILD